MTTNLVKLLDRMEKMNETINELGAKKAEITTMLELEALERIKAGYVPALLAVIRAQDKALNYIAKSAPGPEQLFELENKRMAEITQSEIEKLLEASDVAKY